MTLRCGRTICWQKCGKEVPFDVSRAGFLG